MDASQRIFIGGGELGRRMRALDWQATSLGPPAGWPSQLRTLVTVMLGSKQPMFLAWGSDLALLYNDAYRSILGPREVVEGAAAGGGADGAGEPGTLGRGFFEIWSEIRADVEPLVRRTLAGESVHMDDLALLISCDGIPRERHFTFSYTPVRDDGWQVRGFFCACVETTDRVLAERRQRFRLDVEENLRGCEDAEAVIRSIAASLGRHLGVDRVGYAEVLGDDESVRVRSAYSERVTPLAGIYRLSDFGIAFKERQRRGEILVVADTADPACGLDAAAYAAIAVGSFLSVPTLRAGRLAMTLFVSRAARHHWTEEEVALVATTAARINDAVERQRAEGAARANEARFAVLTQAIPNQVWTATAAGALDWANDRTLRYAGLRDAESGGLDWEALIHPDDLAAAAGRWAASLDSGLPYEVEFRIRRHDGTYRWHIARALPQRDGGGTIIRWIGTNTDIHDQKRVEFDLGEAKVAAEAANRAKSTFIANMSHELRTPLSAIIGYAEMIGEEIGDGTQAADLASDVGRIETNARHLLGLINDVLDLSKVESGKMEAFVETFDLAATVSDVAATVATLVEKKNNRLVVDLGEDGGAALGTMQSDMTRVRQILLNLLSNAAKFTEGGTITLSVRRDEDRIRFTVADSGIGMSAEQVGRLFQRFQQADASTTRQFGGTGLGLALTRAFATMLGGDVAVTSRSGEGSRFTVTLAAALDPAAAAASSDALPLPNEGGGDDTVLVIDDDETQRDLIGRFLQREGFNARMVGDGAAGLALAATLRPRAILLDVTMPGMDGWSVLSALKADPALAAIPVVMVTFNSERALASSLGAADYIIKPIDWPRLRHVMDGFRDREGDVLVIDDEPEMRALARSALERDGWSVSEAENGERGLAAVARAKPRVILLDLSMPVLDGFGFLDELRRQPGCEAIPVVVLSALDLTAAERRRLRGASQILNKGATRMSDLVEKLRRLGGA